MTYTLQSARPITASDLVLVMNTAGWKYAVGPALYVVSSADLHAVKPGNSLVKYADDIYLVMPTCNVDTRDIEIANVDRHTVAAIGQQPQD